MLFEEPALASAPTTPSPAKSVRTLADFEAWCAAQGFEGHRVPGFDQAVYLRWCQHVLLRGEVVAALELPPVAEPAVVTDGDPDLVTVVTDGDPQHDPGELPAATEPGLVQPPPDATDDVDAPLVAYTDGSGTQAHLPCGAGVVVFDGAEVVLEASRHLGLGTNNHAELSAVRVALAITDVAAWRGRELIVRSDSMYAIGSLTRPEEPLPEAKNAKLISVVRRALRGRRVRFEHVKGHSGDLGNERADALAGMARLRGVR